jgi:hypothetical protein
VYELEKPDGTDNREVCKLEDDDTGLSKFLCRQENSKRSNEDQRYQALLNPLALLADL